MIILEVIERLTRFLKLALVILELLVHELERVIERDKAMFSILLSVCLCDGIC